MPNVRVRVIERSGMPNEIVLPETKPETEWVDGRPVQKVSPTYDHALLQMRLATTVHAWVDETKLGRAGTEWRFRVALPEDVVRPLVPDLAYISYDALPKGISRDDLQVPLAAPTVAFEVLSPDDRLSNVRSKIRTFLAAGTLAVVIVDPKETTVTVHDVNGSRLSVPPESVAHRAMPGFVLHLDRLFADMD